MNKLTVLYMKIPLNLTMQDVTEHLKSVSPERRQAVRRYRYEQDQLTGLFAELLLRKELMELTGLDNDQLVFEKGAWGKPYLRGFDDIHFSISHSAGQLVLALHGGEVGADIEVIKKARMKLAGRSFLPEEYEYILNADKTDEAFYYIWTRKEAYIKYTGEGLKRELTSFSVLDTKKNRSNYRSFIQDGAMISLFADDLSESEVLIRQMNVHDLIG